ncbi:MAG: 50S ribosomal protein L31e [Thermoplasmatales archaeon]|nr:50S ribosomal protein L31e [Thermoplasmatales archaeon]
MEEKIYTVPLIKTKNFSRAKRAKIAMKEIREFLKKHTKNDNIKIDKSVNEVVWERGIKNPPSKIRLKVVKVDDTVWAYTPETEIKIEEIEKKKEKKEKKEEKEEKEEEKMEEKEEKGEEEEKEKVEEEKQSHAEKD